MAENIWVRPEHIEYPKKWATFEGHGQVDGKTLQFWIEDMHDEHKDQALQYLLAGFNDEPLCKYARIVEDAVSMGEAQEFLKELINNKLALVCLTMDETGKPIITGVSCLARTAKTDTQKVPTGEVFLNLRDMTTVLYERIDPYVFLNMNEFLMDGGIYVVPKYRRQGICYNFLLSWITVCKEVGQRAVVGTFTSIFSQRAAEKADYMTMVSMKYADLAKMNPKFELPGITEHTTNIQILYKRV